MVIRGGLVATVDAEFEADVGITGGRIAAIADHVEGDTVVDARGCIVDRANAKGFAFEYMTSGRAVVLGDIGPWACAGMTGGRVYCRVNPDWNLDRAAIERRMGEGAKVVLAELDAEGTLDVQDLLGHYAGELRATGQDDQAERVLGLAAEATENFLMVVPEKVQADPNISTE